MFIYSSLLKVLKGGNWIDAYAAVNDDAWLKGDFIPVSPLDGFRKISYVTTWVS